MGTVLLMSGKVVRAKVLVVTGACLVGDPTAFVEINGEIIWVKPGESVDFVEVVEGKA
jgi:hypothetical protein